MKKSVRNLAAVNSDESIILILFTLEMHKRRGKANRKKIKCR